MEVKNVIPNTSGSITASANIDGIQYAYITPKVILNRDIFNNTNYPDYDFNSIESKKEIIKNNHGINAIDIDWNKAIINNNKTYISTTSDLLKALNLAYTYSSAVSDGSEWWYEY